jgi:hypothetical protein
MVGRAFHMSHGDGLRPHCAGLEQCGAKQKASEQPEPELQ